MEPKVRFRLEIGPSGEVRGTASDPEETFPATPAKSSGRQKADVRTWDPDPKSPSRRDGAESPRNSQCNR